VLLDRREKAAGSIDRRAPETRQKFQIISLVLRRASVLPQFNCVGLPFGRHQAAVIFGLPAVLHQNGSILPKFQTEVGRTYLGINLAMPHPTRGPSQVWVVLLLRSPSQELAYLHRQRHGRKLFRSRTTIDIRSTEPDETKAPFLPWRRDGTSACRCGAGRAR
jgi:hypothetical protein